jgi:uncharacterized membrane protein
MTDSSELEYVGFWPRVWASIIDTILIMVVTSPLAAIVYGRGYFSYDYGATIRGPGDFLISFVLPAVVVILFWSAKHATPGDRRENRRCKDRRFTKPRPTYHPVSGLFRFYSACGPGAYLGGVR